MSSSAKWNYALYKLFTCIFTVGQIYFENNTFPLVTCTLRILHNFENTLLHFFAKPHLYYYYYFFFIALERGTIFH